LRLPAPVIFKLAHHLVRQHDGTGDQLREKADEKCVTGE
jgi:hypothetical protein